MTDKIQVVATALAADQEPSAEELAQALTQAIIERDAYKGMANDMVQWWQKLIKAHIEKDVKALMSTMDAFIAERVKIARKPNESVH